MASEVKAERDPREEIAEWLVRTGFPWDWDVEATPPGWLERELAAAWVRHDGEQDATVDDYVLCFRVETMAFRDVA